MDHAQQKAAQAQTDYDDSLKYIAHYTECVGQLTDQLNKANALQADEAALQAEIKELTAKVEKDDTDQESAKALKKKTKELEKIEEMRRKEKSTVRAAPKGTASNEMCTFLILNISSLQLIPVNIIAYRSQYGSVNPAAVVGPGLIATICSTAAAIIFCKLKKRC